MNSYSDLDDNRPHTAEIYGVTHGNKNSGWSPGEIIRGGNIFENISGKTQGSEAEYLNT